MKKVKEREFHGLRKTSEYNTWCGMRQRCKNKNAPSYKSYGGRGISVCERWDLSFINFLNDMGKKPSKAHSIERIDNELGYSPGNCRWALIVEQSNNRRTSRLITINGDTKTLAEWAKVSDVSSQVILSRIDKLGWGENDLLNPVSEKVFAYKNCSCTLTQLSVRIGFNYDTVRQRIEKLGWPIERAIETPAKFDKNGASFVIYSALGLSLTLKQWAEKTGIKYGTLIARIRAGKPFEVAISDPLNTRHSRT